jgi:hypothetical protein
LQHLAFRVAATHSAEVRVLRFLLGAAAAVAVAMGCGSTMVPAAAPASGQGLDLQAAGEGVSVSVGLDRAEVPSGDSVLMTVTVENHRDEPVVYAVQECNLPVLVQVTTAVPLEPPGRDWPGIRGDFKRYALDEGFAPAGFPARGPIRTTVTPRNCAMPEAQHGTVAAGASVVASLEWSAEGVPGVGVVPGGVPFTVSLAYDPGGAASAAAGDPNPATALQGTEYEGLVVDGRIQVVGEAPGVLSAGQAIDVLLSDLSFAGWLEQQPAATWSVANVYMFSYPTRSGDVPAGPHWAVELFRENGVPRHWAIAHIEPVDGTLQSLRYCNIPCDR